MSSVFLLLVSVSSQDFSSFLSVNPYSLFSTVENGSGYYKVESDNLSSVEVGSVFNAVPVGSSAALPACSGGVCVVESRSGRFTKNDFDCRLFRGNILGRFRSRCGLFCR